VGCCVRTRTERRRWFRLVNADIPISPNIRTPSVGSGILIAIREWERTGRIRRLPVHFRGTFSGIRRHYGRLYGTSRRSLEYENGSNREQMNLSADTMASHADYIDARIRTMLRSKATEYDNCIIGGSDTSVLLWMSPNICTNYVQRFFTKTHMKKHPCPCGKPSEQRCHGIGEERPVLLLRALHRLRGDTEDSVKIRDLMVAFFEEHKTTGFVYKCKQCHLKEPKLGKPCKKT